MKNIGIILLVIIVGLSMCFGWFRNGYDTAVAKSERVKSGWAQVENQLQRRNDLIPNLVNTVKGFATQEKSIFMAVLRSAVIRDLSLNALSARLTAPINFSGVRSTNTNPLPFSGCRSASITVSARPPTRRTIGSVP